MSRLSHFRASVFTSLGSALVLVGLLCPSLCSQPAGGRPGMDSWKYDVVHLRNGQTFRGLVLKQTKGEVWLRYVIRRPGRATIANKVVFEPREVRRVVLLPEAERKVLRERIERLYKERQALTERLRALNVGTKEPMAGTEALDLRSAKWSVGEASALEYRSTYFRLISDARPELVRLAAIKLEQIYAAYTTALPPRPDKLGKLDERRAVAGEPPVRKVPPLASPGPLSVKGNEPEPTTILLAKSWKSYAALVRKRRYDLTNPAFYDRARNEIVCGCDLPRLGDALERARKQHEELAKTLRERLGELRKVYQPNKIPPELKEPILDLLKTKIPNTERRNQARFAQARRQLFRMLYHEAFHAYVDHFVYPHQANATEASGLPRWLDEGLAQIFETAIVEVGELRVGHADPHRVKVLRGALASDELLPLTKLLRSQPRDFLVAHKGKARDQQASDDHYLASWALAFYLTFERKLLGSKKLDAYVRSLQRGTDPLDAFTTLVGQPLSEFEKDYRKYLNGLR